MKRIPRGVAAAIPCISAIWFSAICLAAFWIIVSASAAADAQTSAGGLNPAEKWVIAQVSAGEIADLSKKFAADKDRKLSGHFLGELLAGALPGVKPHRNGVRIIWAIIDEPIDLSNSQISYEVWLGYCKFNSSATFRRASFAGVVSFDGSRFKEEVTFNGVKVGDVASFSDAVFEGPVNFVGADIASEFRADGAHFQNKEKIATFGGMKVRGYAFFSDAVFEGPVHFIAADIAGNFEAERAKFQQGADFWGMKVEGDADIAGAVFEGMARFSRVNITSDFEAIETKFQNKESGADFFGMKIGGNAVLTGAVFEGPARFDAAEIAGSLKLGAKFQHGASFQRMKVLGSASFYHAIFEDVADFHYADFGSLFLWPVSWPKHTPHSHMQGMNYKYFQAAAEEPKSHKELLKLADQSSYTADVYSTLEDFFRRQGYRDDADKAFIAGKRREREEYFRERDWFGWMRSWTLNLLVGYGRRPWQAAIPCTVLIVLGYVFFSPNKMEPRNPAEAHGVYSRFWYSLGLFLPFVDLQADRVWKPKADQTFLRNYMRVHILLGWILIPIVLAALTGLIK
jgi:uncharacterized protein YjbI with pentapeptide repeats